MKKIGQGWQYAVYDLDNGRVRKQTSPTIIQYVHILCNNIFTKFNIFADAWSNMQRVRSVGKLSNDYIKDILPIFDAKLLGNPVFLGDGYEQDKVTTLGDIFKKCSVTEGKNIFDAYVRLIHTTWQYSFADVVFNFSVNNSLDKKWRVIQIDFGELVFDRNDVEKDIRKKQWLHCSSYKSFPPGEMKNYYRDLMEKEMTIEKLEKLWGKEIVKFHYRPAKKNKSTSNNISYNNPNLSII